MADWWMLCCGFVVIRDVVAGIIFMHTGVLLCSQLQRMRFLGPRMRMEGAVVLVVVAASLLGVLVVVWWVVG